LNKSLKIEGDVCEFGVAQGATSALLANEIRATEKKLWLFDSFQGLPKPTEKDVLIDDIFNLKSIEDYEGEMSYPIEMVEARLKAISFPSSRVKIVPGFIEETIDSPDLPQKVCFAYLDFDFYLPILTSLKFLNQRLSTGGIIVVDDYDFFSSGVKTAVKEFIEEYPGDYEIINPHKFAGHFCILRKIG
jgi:cephalosporin hydroxylase